VSELNFELLREHSEMVGNNADLVQAGGGNTSLKTDSGIWIKASGTRLKNSKSNHIFVYLEIAVLNSSEIASIEDFSPYVVGNQSADICLTPSIETNFHLLIRKPVVTHLHSLGSLMIAISDCAIEIVEEMSAQFNIAWIPYARPGVGLANLIQKVALDTSTVYILQNHGVIFSADSFESINVLIEEFESIARKLNLNKPQKDENPTWIEVLTGGVLTPDEAVFLGSVPFSLSNESDEARITISNRGEVNIPISFNEDKIQVANFYVRLAKAIHKRTKVAYLTSQEVHALLNWDKEIFRNGLAK
jgi:rhamnose utilization protein RhaD (predicted bifunctional aldolase and dehydrogenase)